MKANRVGCLAVVLTLASCAQQGALRSGETFTTRELTAEEIGSLSVIIAEGLKDPDSAHIKWMPVVLRERDGITDYCGLINGKNSFGGYTGYTRFYGQLIKDNAGRFTRIVVRAIEEPNREFNIFDNRWLNGICENYGYINFAFAHSGVAASETEAVPATAAAPAPKGQTLGIKMVSTPPAVAPQLQLDEGRGLLVLVVEKDGSAEKAGIRQGDVILECNYRPTNTPAEIHAVLAAAQQNAPVNCKLWSVSGAKDNKPVYSEKIVTIALGAPRAEAK